MKSALFFNTMSSLAIYPLVITTTLLSLTSCGGSYLESIDKQTVLISASKEKVLSPRSSVELSIVTTRGSAQQKLHTGERIEGIRTESPTTLENSHSFHALVANYSFNVLNRDTVKLSIEPGASMSYYGFDANGENLNTSLDGTILSYGLNFETRLRVAENVELAAHLLMHMNIDASDSLTGSGISVILNRPRKPDVSIGYRILSAVHDREYPKSDVVMESRGLHLGFLF